MEASDLCKHYPANTENNFIPRARGYLKLFTLIENHREGPGLTQLRRTSVFSHRGPGGVHITACHPQLRRQADGWRAQVWREQPLSWACLWGR